MENPKTGKCQKSISKSWIRTHLELTIIPPPIKFLQCVLSLFPSQCPAFKRLFKFEKRLFWYRAGQCAMPGQHLLLKNRRGHASVFCLLWTFSLRDQAVSQRRGTCYSTPESSIHFKVSLYLPCNQLVPKPSPSQNRCFIHTVCLPGKDPNTCF